MEEIEFNEYQRKFTVNISGTLNDIADEKAIVFRCILNDEEFEVLLLQNCVLIIFIDITSYYRI